MTILSYGDGVCHGFYVHMNIKCSEVGQVFRVSVAKEVVFSFY